MALAIFDLDNTLLGGDSDYSWGRYLCENGIVDEEKYRQANDMYLQQYQDGELDIYAFLEFVFTPLAQHDFATLEKWRAEYLEQKIEPMVLPDALALVEKHRAAGDTLMIITATNSFLTTPIAERYGIDNLIGTDPEFINGQFTGKVTGTPSFQHGKVERLKEWLAANNQSLEGSVFYSDSHNDIPLLKQVDTAVAVDPDPKLQAYAEQQGWQVISLRNNAN